jgi:hypothetical protein
MPVLLALTAPDQADEDNRTNLTSPEKAGGQRAAKAQGSRAGKQTSLNKARKIHIVYLYEQCSNNLICRATGDAHGRQTA